MDMSNFVKDSDAEGTDDYAEESKSGADSNGESSSVSNEDSGPVRTKKSANSDLKDASGKKPKHRRIQKGLSSDSSDGDVNDDKATNKSNSNSTKDSTSSPAKSPHKKGAASNLNSRSPRKQAAAVAPISTPEKQSRNSLSSPPDVGNDPVTYTFKAKVNGHHDVTTTSPVTNDVTKASSVTSSTPLPVSAPQQQQHPVGVAKGGADLASSLATTGAVTASGPIRGSLESDEREQTDTEVDEDDLSDIGDIVDYINQDI